jgi:hypothetical protein
VEEKKNDLRERLFEFAVRVIEFFKILPTFLKIKLFVCNYPKVLRHLGHQKADFTNKVRILIRGNEGIKSLVPSSKNPDNQTLQSWF